MIARLMRFRPLFSCILKSVEICRYLSKMLYAMLSIGVKVKDIAWSKGTRDILLESLELLKSGSTLGPHRLVPYSPIKLLEFGLRPIRRHYLGDCHCCMQKTVGEVLG